MSRPLSERIPPPPPQAPRIRVQRFWRWVARCLIGASDWHIVGAFPDLPKFIGIAAPHSANWDGIFGISSAYAMDIRATWMGKSSLFKGGLGRVMRGLGGIATDRSAANGAVGQMAELMRTAERMWLFIAPEGTRKPVKKWRTGFWHIASQAQVPLVLIYLDYPNSCIRIGEVFHLSGDKERDLAELYERFRPYVGKNGKSGLPAGVQ